MPMPMPTETPMPTKKELPMPMSMSMPMPMPMPTRLAWYQPYLTQGCVRRETQHRGWSQQWTLSPYG